MAQWNLEKLLARLGVGSRKDCHRYIRDGIVQVNGEVVSNPKELYTQLPSAIVVGGETIDVVVDLYLILNKPAGYECSHRPQNHDSVFSLFPERMLSMDLQCVGRLDVDTTGLLLLSNQGSFIHTVESPRKGFGKTYEAVLADPLEVSHQEQLLAGVELRSEKGLFKAMDLQMLSDKHVRMTVGEGVYHQVKRMFAAVGNKVESLHRLSIGDLVISADLAPGAWRYLSDTELEWFGVSKGTSL